LQDHAGNALVGVTGDMAGRTGGRPGGGQQRMAALHGFDEARHRDVGPGHGLEQSRSADQLRPPAALLGEFFPRRPRGREGVRFMLKAAYPYTHRISPDVAWILLLT